jgi:hypothetical protein
MWNALTLRQLFLCLLDLVQHVQLLDQGINVNDLGETGNNLF